jgi:CDP-4-dehydro-6-deoxyglucose reductase, E3
MSFSVTLHSTGERFRVAHGESILHAARRQGVDLPCGCQTGVCGACISRILSGQLFYPGGVPMALFGEDADKGLCCVGFPRSDLVIEPEHLGEDCEPWV